MTILRVTESWEQRAQNKRESTLNCIPSKWRLKISDLDRAGRQRDLTGHFIEGFLDPETVQITALDTTEIVAALQNRTLSAVQVTTAFCQTAAVAHQIVS